MWDVGDHLLAAFIFSQLVATDDKHPVRWLVLSITFVILGFLKDAQIHGAF